MSNALTIQEAAFQAWQDAQSVGIYLLLAYKCGHRENLVSARAEFASAIQKIDAALAADADVVAVPA